MSDSSPAPADLERMTEMAEGLGIPPELLGMINMGDGQPLDEAALAQLAEQAGDELLAELTTGVDPRWEELLTWLTKRIDLDSAPWQLRMAAPLGIRAAKEKLAGDPDGARNDLVQLISVAVRALEITPEELAAADEENPL
jgi:hypothetical protein